LHDDDAYHGPRKWWGEGQEGPGPPPIPLGAIHVIGPFWKMLAKSASSLAADLGHG